MRPYMYLNKYIVRRKYVFISLLLDIIHSWLINGKGDIYDL